MRGQERLCVCLTDGWAARGAVCACMHWRMESKTSLLDHSRTGTRSIDLDRPGFPLLQIKFELKRARTVTTGLWPLSFLRSITSLNPARRRRVCAINRLRSGGSARRSRAPCADDSSSSFSSLRSRPTTPVNKFALLQIDRW